MDSRLFSEANMFCFLFSRSKHVVLLDAAVGIRALTYPGLVATVCDDSNSNDRKLSKYYMMYN